MMLGKKPRIFILVAPEEGLISDIVFLSFLWRFVFVVTHWLLLQVPCIELLLVVYANRVDGGKYERVYEIVVGRQPSVGAGLPRPAPIMNSNKISTTHSSMEYVTYFVTVHDRPPPVTIGGTLSPCQSVAARYSTVMLSAAKHLSAHRDRPFTAQRDASLRSA